MQKQKRAQLVMYVKRYAALLLCITATGIIGCQQPTKSLKKETKQGKNPAESSPKPEKDDKQKTPYPGEITYRGLEIPQTLSRFPQEYAVTETLIGENESELIETGVPVKYITKEIAYDVSAAFDNNLLLDPAQNSIYPGAVIAGDSIDDGSYRQITNGNKRKAMISFSLQGVKDKSGKAGITSGEIIPNLAAYRDLHNTVLSQKITYHASAHSSYEEKDIKNEESFDTNFKVGVGFSAVGIKAKIGAGFKFKSGENKHRHLIKFVETFYTVDVNQDNAPLMTDIPRELLGERMPVYVSSVSYGRIAYLSIVSDKTWDEMKLSFETVLKATPNSAEVEISDAIKKLNEGTDITINIIGGSSEAVTDLKQFSKYIQKGGFSSGNPGQIIKYKLRFLEDNATAHIKYGGRYKTVERTKVVAENQKVTGAVKKITCKGGYTYTASVSGTIGMHPKDKNLPKENIFEYIDNAKLSVPWGVPKPIDSPEKSIIVSGDSAAIRLSFDIKEQKKPFVTDKNGKDNEPIVLRIEDLKKTKTHTFTVYEKGNPQKTITFEIDFTVK